MTKLCIVTSGQLLLHSFYSLSLHIKKFQVEEKPLNLEYEVLDLRLDIKYLSTQVSGSGIPLQVHFFYESRRHLQFPFINCQVCGKYK